MSLKLLQQMYVIRSLKNIFKVLTMYVAPHLSPRGIKILPLENYRMVCIK